MLQMKGFLSIFVLRLTVYTKSPTTLLVAGKML
jgi:hypothetical protein